MPRGWHLSSLMGVGKKHPNGVGVLRCPVLSSLNRLQAAQLPGSEKGLELVGKTGAIWLLRVGVPVGASSPVQMIGVLQNLGEPGLHQ